MAKFMAGFIIGICCGMIFLAWSVVSTPYSSIMKIPAAAVYQ